MNIYNEIIDINNITQAYFEIVEKLEETSRTHRYSGFDGKTLSQYDFFSEDLLNEIQIELINNNTITPALERHIPKRNKPGIRPIYIHTIKERIKGQAVYRVVEPYFDKFFSEYLFSYRSSHPHYKAIKTVVRRYLKDQSGHLLIGDIASYSDIINPDILKNKISEIGFDSKTNNILYSYIDMEFLDQGIKKTSPFGIITGLPITVMFNNLYLDAFDKEVGPSVKLYRRIGDDFIAFDSLKNLFLLKEKMSQLLIDLKIPLSSQKINIQKVSESFNFLGYLFENSVISILPYSLNNIKILIRSKLKFSKFTSIKYKIIKLKKILFEGNSIRHYFIQIIRQYNHVNNDEQIRRLSDYFFKRLTIYFFGIYSPRNQRKTKKTLEGTKIPSLMRYYTAYHTGQYKGKELMNIK